LSAAPAINLGVTSRPLALLSLAAFLAIVVTGCFEQERTVPGAPPRPQPLPGELQYVVAYSTFFGGRADESVRNILVYPDGSVLVGIGTWSSDLPTSPGALQREYAGEDPSLGHWGVVGGDNFLLRLAPDGSRLEAATYLGGSRQERDVYGMLLDATGNIVVTSTTRSRDLPTTPGAFQPEYAGGDSDVYVAKINADLTRLVWCTYLGGEGADTAPGGLEITPSGDIVVVSLTNSTDFPTTVPAIRTPVAGDIDAVITKLSPAGELLWSTRLGGSRADAAVGVRSALGSELFVVGNTASPDFPTTAGALQSRLAGRTDSFLVSLSEADGALLWSTLVGGSGSDLPEHRPAFDSAGNVIFTGVTDSADFPVSDGAFQRTHGGAHDGFVTALSAEAGGLVWSTLLGGGGAEGLLLPTVMPDGSIIVVGATSSPDFPVTDGALQREYGGGKLDAVIAILSPDGSKLRYSSYLGGRGEDQIRGVALGSDGALYVVGMTSSRAFPVTSNAFQRRLGGGSDAFIAKLVPRSR
jgi:hypothetical protein